ncbi:hypothetical protein TSH100_11585 [Azospirillum sp. TSH100]|nr:hypothetical protein TSH100_11585 [Azospirillum sp. TSH100]
MGGPAGPVRPQCRRDLRVEWRAGGGGGVCRAPQLLRPPADRPPAGRQSAEVIRPTGKKDDPGRVAPTG